MTDADIPQIDGFADLALIGRGGFSHVYSARQLTLNRAVAIKVIDATGSAARRFEREALALGALSGISNIVTTYQVAVSGDGRPALVMELLPTSIAQLAAGGPIRTDQVVRWATQLAGALDRAHRLGIHHRDIKPENVLINSEGDALLADFGIASLVELASATTTSMSLSPPFAPPERFTGSERDARAGDIYSLGATVYAALAGRPPFGTAADGGALGLMTRIASEELPTIASQSPELNAALRTCLAKQESDRFRSAGQLAAAMNKALEAVEAHGALRGTTYLRYVPTPVIDSPTILRVRPNGEQGHDLQPTGVRDPLSGRPSAGQPPLDPEPSMGPIERAGRATWRRWLTKGALYGAVPGSLLALHAALSDGLPLGPFASGGLFAAVLRWASPSKDRPARPILGPIGAFIAGGTGSLAGVLLVLLGGNVFRDSSFERTEVYYVLASALNLAFAFGGAALFAGIGQSWRRTVSNMAGAAGGGAVGGSLVGWYRSGAAVAPLEPVGSHEWLEVALSGLAVMVAMFGVIVVSQLWRRAALTTAPSGRVVSLRNGSASIGASGRCTVTLPPGTEVLERHATIDFEAGPLLVVAGPTEVNGRRVEGRTEIRDGDVITVDQHDLVFSDPDQVEASWVRRSRLVVVAMAVSVIVAAAAGASLVPVLR